MQALLKLTNTIQKNATATHHRQILRLKGEQAWCFQQAQFLIEQLQQSYFWIGESPANIKSTNYKNVLGQETSLLVINALQQFDANAFAAAEGTLKGGGLLILLSPASISEQNYFYTYIEEQLLAYNFTTVIQSDAIQTIPPLLSSTPVSSHINCSQQNLAIAAVIKTVTGHRRRPLVLTANRGRGKSAALGIAAAKLVNTGISKILVCAPNKQASYTLFKHASLLITGNEKHQYCIEKDNQYIHFIAPDRLFADTPNCDLLIIDEAAAIPVSMLEQFASHYSRIVFASTLQGYEGSGRGFALRFQKRLSEISPQWRQYQLTLPVRWAENDPVERFTLDNLCLVDVSATNPHYDRQGKVQIIQLQAKQLINDFAQLRTIFSLLVTAHYQTKPSDLAMLLNDTSLSIFVLKQNEQLLGVALINQEGGFEQSIAEKIWSGNRRVKGNLVAQSLTFHSANIKAAQQRYARIQRIAIHPSCQDQGLGKLFITHIQEWAHTQHFDHCCASFSATAPLLAFWQQLNFTTLRIGSTQDNSSGSHSIIVNHPLSAPGKKLHTAIQQDFQMQFPMQLSRHLQQINADLVLAFLREFPKCSNDSFDLTSYIEGNRPYEMVEYALQELVLNNDISMLQQPQQALIIAKVLQNNSWAEICQKYQYTGKKQAQQLLKIAIHQLCESTIRRNLCD